MAKEFCHISLLRRNGPDGINLGGVEEFCVYLRRAVPGMEAVSWADFPDHHRYPELQDYEKAEVLNSWLLSAGYLDESSVVVVDGYWGRGLEGRVKRLISVCHGTYYGRLIANQVSPWGEIVGIDHVEAQYAMWHDEHVETVAVSADSLRELRLLGLDGEVILHGVDLDVLKPTKNKNRVFMHAATSARKGADMIDAIMKLSGCAVEFFAESSGTLEGKSKRFSQAKALVAPTRHEGNAYLLIEALACGVPLLTFSVGLALEMDERCGFITDDISPHALARAMIRFDELSAGFAPREWAEENCSFEDFARAWRKKLGA